MTGRGQAASGAGGRGRCGWRRTGLTCSRSISPRAWSLRSGPLDGRDGPADAGGDRAVTGPAGGLVAGPEEQGGDDADVDRGEPGIGGDVVGELCEGGGLHRAEAGAYHRSRRHWGGFPMSRHAPGGLDRRSGANQEIRARWYLPYHRALSLIPPPSPRHNPHGYPTLTPLAARRPGHARPASRTGNRAGGLRIVTDRPGSTVPLSASPRRQGRGRGPGRRDRPRGRKRPRSPRAWSSP